MSELVSHEARDEMYKQSSSTHELELELELERTWLTPAMTSSTSHRSY